MRRPCLSKSVEFVKSFDQNPSIEDNEEMNNRPGLNEITDVFCDRPSSSIIV